MGRPAKFSRDDAVAIAMDAFWAKGYEAVSVSELASAMSITRSSFYNSFKTRDALFDEVIELYSKATPDYFLSELEPGAPIVPAIRGALKSLCQDRASDPRSRGCMIVNCLALVEGQNSAPPQLITMMSAKLERYSSLLVAAVEAGELPSDYEAHDAARAILIHMMGINMMSKVVKDEASLWRSTELFLNGLGLAE